MNKDEKILEILNSKPTQKIGLDDFYGRQTVINMLKEAINYSQCCKQLLCLDDDFNFLTKGKIYEMVSEPDGHYVVIDDFGEERLLWKKYFKILN